jgi:hypothetical protein
MSGLLPSELPVTFTSDWGDTFDCRELGPEAISKAGYHLFHWQIPVRNAWYNRSFRLGEVGCTMNHINCWRRADATTEQFIMILEDDVVLADRFLETLLQQLNRLVDRGIDFGLLYLGREYLARPWLKLDRPLWPGLVYAGFSGSSMAYVLTRSGLRTILNARLDQDLIVIDEFLATLYCDHPRPDVQARFPRCLTALALDPPVVGSQPYSKENPDSDNIDSDYLPRLWRPFLCK